MLQVGDKTSLFVGVSNLLELKILYFKNGEWSCWDVTTIGIIGASFAGLRAYNYLKKHDPSLKLLLFDKEKQFTYNPSLHLVLANPDYLKKIQFDIAKYYDNFINEEVVEVTEKQVITANASYDCDYIIVASGAGTNYYGNSSLKQHSYPAKTAHQVLRVQEKIEKGEQVVIIGGGLTGVEYACMLGNKFRHNKDKFITLVSATPKLLPAFPDINHRKALAYLKKAGVRVLLDEKAVHAGPNWLELSGGMKLHSDCTMMCAGLDMSASFCPTNDVDQHFRLVGMSNVYFAGDVNRKGNFANAHNAMIEGEEAAKRILAYLVKGDPTITKHSNWELAAVAIGPSGGLFSNTRSGWVVPFTGLAKKFIEWRVLHEFKTHKLWPI